MPDRAKNRSGRTSNGGYVRYSPDFVSRLFEYLIGGKTVFEFCCDLGCSRSTFYKWVKKYPEFETAFRKGKQARKAAKHIIIIGY